MIDFDDDYAFDRYEEYEPSIYNGDAPAEDGVADDPVAEALADEEEAPETERDDADEERRERAGEQAFEDSLFLDGPDLPDLPEPPETDLW